MWLALAPRVHLNSMNWIEIQSGLTWLAHLGRRFYSSFQLLELRQVSHASDGRVLLSPGPRSPSDRKMTEKWERWPSNSMWHLEYFLWSPLRESSPPAQWIRFSSSISSYFTTLNIDSTFSRPPRTCCRDTCTHATTRPHCEGVSLMMWTVCCHSYSSVCMCLP